MKYATFFPHIYTIADTYEGMSMESVMHRLAAKGLEATDMDSHLVGKLGADYINKLHRDAGLSIASMFHYIGFDYKNPDILNIMRDKTKQAVEYCAAIGSPYIMPVPAATGPHESEEARNDALKLVTAYLAEVAEESEKCGIQTVVENFSNPNTPLAYISDISYILDNLPNVRYVLDTGNFYFGGTDMLTACKEFADKTVHVHLKDLDDNGTGLTVCGKTVQSVAIGDGILPIYEAIKHLGANGYDGALTIEINHDSGILESVEKSLENLRNNIG